MGYGASEAEPFKRVSLDEGKALIEAGTVEVVDVRQPSEWAEGHIPQARLIPLSEVMSRANELSAERPILFVCAVGERSAVACEMAAALGFEELYNLEGGTEGWKRRAWPIAY